MTYLTANELADRLRYDARYIHEVLRPRCFAEGRHYVRPFGRRKVLYIWEHIEEDMYGSVEPAIPMANGGVCNG